MMETIVIGNKADYMSGWMMLYDALALLKGIDREECCMACVEFYGKRYEGMNIDAMYEDLAEHLQIPREKLFLYGK